MGVAFIAFETGSHHIAEAGLKHVMCTRLALTSQKSTDVCLPSARIKDKDVLTTSSYSGDLLDLKRFCFIPCFFLHSREQEEGQGTRPS